MTDWEVRYWVSFVYSMIVSGVAGVCIGKLLRVNKIVKELREIVVDLRNKDEDGTDS